MTLMLMEVCLGEILALLITVNAFHVRTSFFFFFFLSFASSKFLSPFLPILLLYLKSTGGSPDKKTPSRQNSISPSRQNSMSPSRNRLSRNSSSAMMDPSSSSSQRRNSRSPSPGGLRRDESHQSSRELGSNDRHHSTSGGIGGGGGGGSRDGSRGGGGSGSSSMRRRSSGVGDLKRRPSSTTMGVMGNGRGWERMSRQASRPSFSVAGSETGSTVREERWRMRREMNGKYWEGNWNHVGC